MTCETKLRTFARLHPTAIFTLLLFGLAVLSAPASLRAAEKPPENLLVLQNYLADLASKLQPAVVNISTTQAVKGPKGVPLPQVPKGSPFEEFFKDHFDNKGKPRQQRRVSSLGSGFIIDASGLIVTNNHVIADADEIVITLSDETKLTVTKVLGRDPKTDLALLKVEPKKPLPFVSFGDSSLLRVGYTVIAIGNPFGLGGSLTTGVVSAKKRDINAGPYDEFVQTDAAINKGNSGGPLFNIYGEVVGVNTAIISPSGGSIGIGFAVPSNTAIHIIEQLRKYGKTRRGWLGVRIQTVTDEIAESIGMSEPMGALVAGVTADGPAKEGGLEVGDIILKFNKSDVEKMRNLPKIVARTPIGENVPVEILRKGLRKTITVKIGLLEEDKQQASLTPADEQPKDAPADTVLGLTVSRLTDELRTQFKIGKDVQGVVVVEVDPKSQAAEKNIRPGDVVVEVTQEAVTAPGQIASRVAALKKTGRRRVLFLISGTKGELRFVTVPLEAKSEVEPEVKE